MSQEEFTEHRHQVARGREFARDSSGPFTELVYQPMAEVLEYLRANQFKTFIVTGGGQDFVRTLFTRDLRQHLRRRSSAPASSRNTTSRTTRLS